MWQKNTAHKPAYSVLDDWTENPENIEPISHLPLSFLIQMSQLIYTFCSNLATYITPKKKWELPPKIASRLILTPTPSFQEIN